MQKADPDDEPLETVAMLRDLAKLKKKKKHRRHRHREPSQYVLMDTIVEETGSLFYDIAPMDQLEQMA